MHKLLTMVCLLAIVVIPAGAIEPVYHDADVNQDSQIDLTELLRVIQFYNVGGYSYCPDDGTEDGFCPDEEPLEYDLAVVGMKVEYLGDPPWPHLIVDIRATEILPSIFRISFYLDGTLAGNLIESYDVQPNVQRWLYGCRLPDIMGNGNHSATVVIDVGNDIIEIDETNNSWEITFRVPPDDPVEGETEGIAEGEGATEGEDLVRLYTVVDRPAGRLEYGGRAVNANAPDAHEFGFLGYYPRGEIVTLQAVPDPGFRFNSWSAAVDNYFSGDITTITLVRDTTMVNLIFMPEEKGELYINSGFPSVNGYAELFAMFTWVDGTPQEFLIGVPADLQWSDVDHWGIALMWPEGYRLELEDFEVASLGTQSKFVKFDGTGCLDSAGSVVPDWDISSQGWYYVYFVAESDGSVYNFNSEKIVPRKMATVLNRNSAGNFILN